MKHKPARDTNRTRKAHDERIRLQLERYHGKSALMETYEGMLPRHSKTYQRLKHEVHRLREMLIVKGVL